MHLFCGKGVQVVCNHTPSHSVLGKKWGRKPRTKSFSTWERKKDARHKLRSRIQPVDCLLSEHVEPSGVARAPMHDFGEHGPF